VGIRNAPNTLQAARQSFRKGPDPGLLHAHRHNLLDTAEGNLSPQPRLEKPAGHVAPRAPEEPFSSSL
jgi:hypothetical protein